MRMSYVDELMGLINIVDKSKCKDFVSVQLPTIDAKCRQLRFTTTESPDGDMPLSQFSLEHTIVNEDCLIEICCESMDELADELDKQVFDKMYEVGIAVDIIGENLQTDIILRSQQIAVDTRRGSATAILSPIEIDLGKILTTKYIDKSRDSMLLAYKGNNEYDAGLTIIPIHFQHDKLAFRGEKDKYNLSFYLCLGPDPERYIRIIKGIK